MLEVCTRMLKQRRFDMLPSHIKQLPDINFLVLDRLCNELGMDTSELGPKYSSKRTLALKERQEQYAQISPRRFPLSELLIKVRGNRSQQEVADKTGITRQLIAIHEKIIAIRGNFQIPTDEQLKLYADIYHAALEKELSHWGVAAKADGFEVLKQLRDEQVYLNYRDKKPVPPHPLLSDFIRSYRISAGISQKEWLI